MGIEDLIKKLAETGDEVYSIACKVKEVHESDRTCDVEPLDGAAEIFGVRLQAEQKLEEGICIFPKVDSIVLVTFINKQTGYVALCSKVSKTIVKLGSLEFELHEDEALLKVGSQLLEVSEDSVRIEGFLKAASGANGLKKALDELLDDLAAATITTPAGPNTGLFDPAVITKFQLLKTKIATFLK